MSFKKYQNKYQNFSYHHKLCMINTSSYFFANTDKSLREKLALDILEWAPIESKVYFIMINVCILKLIY